MRTRIIYGLAAIGVLAGLIAAFLLGRERPTQPPAFAPVASPYDTAIYANGIIESEQGSGSNVNVYSEVSGPITKVLVQEGQVVSAGTLLATIDATVQQGVTDQARAQSDAALAVLSALRAQPRKEVLAIALAQVELAKSSLKVARDQYDKRRASYDADPHSIAKDVLDTAADNVQQAEEAVGVADNQYELVRVGAWSYDIISQQKQYEALKKAYEAANALLLKYSVKAPIDGVILAVNATVGSYVSAQGAYDTYTQGLVPLLAMGAPQQYLAVRCFVDEILVSRLPTARHIRAQMAIRGTDVKVPLEFVRIQPYVSPKIELSNQRQERVDLRVLPVIFRFRKQDAPVYPGQLVDVYIGQE